MEIEAKIKLKSPSRLRALLRSADAENKSEATLEKNWLYDYPDRTLARAGKLLRLRQDSRVLLTFKGPRQESEYKKREEVEFKFPELLQTRSLLESIGFIKWFYYEKYRETWKLGNCEVVLDELPDLGLYVEVEGPTNEEIETIIKRLKLPRRYITDTYIELLQERSRQSETHRLDFMFAPDHKPVLKEKKKSWR